ncbi:type II toxin-antitoxin system death-on-curing family toxin [Thalassospira alkalitolerans]|uniref:type II toxin-antitoxin system death-on-curing family toxin n=1 Tax=Thalassospira alkalitolerans TaxID=1293890 RepID=UPI003AA88AE5
MTAPTWVTRVDVEAIHETMIEIGGGSYGLRDAALLESALARPQNLYAYGKTNIFLLAASYSEGIARNHPFIDGNKRTALLTADLFLADNGLHLNKAIGLTYVEMMERLGQGLMTRDEATDIFRMNCQPA